MTLPIDYSAMLVGVFGYAVYHLLQHCTKSTPTPKKMVEEEQEVTPPAAEPRSDPKKVLHNVLPSVGSIQLAVIVVARAAAKDMEIPTEPQAAFSLLYILYRCVASLKFATLVEDVETSNAAPKKNVEKEQKEAHPPAAEPNSKPQKVLNNVFPSTGSIQLAVMVVARAAAKDMGIPTEPLLACSFLYVLYRCVASSKLAKAVDEVGQSDSLKQPANETKPSLERKKVLNNVLPSVGSVQLAVIVVARAAAKDMEIPTEPQIAFSLLYILYRCVATPKLATLVEDLATKNTKHSCLKTVQEEQKEAHPPAAEPSSKPQKVLNNVLPSEGSIQLAVMLLARAAAKDAGLPTEPVIAFSLLCILYRCVAKLVQK